MKTSKQAKLSFLSLVFILFVSINANAQVTIGSNSAPDDDALLDLKERTNGSSDKGILFPRVELSSTTAYSPLSKPVKGMVVYNTKVTADVVEGLYYHDGIKWNRVDNTPKFFYMPSFNLPTDTSDPAYNSGTSTFTIELYKIYSEQFGLVHSSSSAKSPNAGIGSLPVYLNTSLSETQRIEYYITYYDNTVFDQVTVDNTGKLTYKLLPGFTITEDTFMNIVLKVY